MSTEEETTIHRSTMKLMDKLYKALKQRDQYKAERDTIIDDLSWYKAKVSRLERENERLKEIKQEKEQLEESFQYQLEKRLEYFTKYQELKKENKALRLQSDTYFEQWQEVKKELEDYQDDYEMVTGNCIYWEDKAHWLEDESFKCINLLSEFSQHIGNKPSSSTYKYFRAKLDGIGIKEDE